jgi:hypothetical protein
MAGTANEVNAAENTRKTTKTVAPKPRLVAKSKSGSTRMKAISHEEIERLAHRFWSERGYQHGQAELDWFRAEQELRSKAS